MAEKLTDKLVREMAPPGIGNRIVYDAEVKGFGARITAAGARSFVLNYRINGRERRHTIGGFPAWSVRTARDEAAKLKRDIDRAAIRSASARKPARRRPWPNWPTAISRTMPKRKRRRVRSRRIAAISDSTSSPRWARLKVAATHAATTLPDCTAA